MNYTKLIVSVVDHGVAGRLARITRAAGARGGTILVGRGSATSLLFRILALADTERDILHTLVTDSEEKAVLDSIRSAPCFTKKCRGIVFTIQLGGTAMNGPKDHELITVIVNRGYADDVMDAARKAGARGGTIIHARGTGKPDDERFFGITIVPEKETVLILSERNGSAAIKNAIAGLPCLKEQGIGIMYTTPVEQFYQLGVNS